LGVGVADGKHLRVGDTAGTTSNDSVELEVELKVSIVVLEGQPGFDQRIWAHGHSVKVNVIGAKRGLSDRR